MTLRWLLGDVVVDESVFLPGKDLVMEAVGVDPAPGQFEPFQVYSSAMRQILKHVGVRERRALSPVPVVAGSDGAVRGDRAWKLPAVRGLRKSAGYIFAADGADSGPVYCSRLGKARVRPAAGLKAVAQDPSGSLRAEAGLRIEVETVLQLAIDPELSVTLLTGPELVEHMLANLAADVAEDEDEDVSVAARVETVRDELAETLRDAYTPPDDWVSQLDVSSLNAQAGQRVAVTVGIDPPTLGIGYFAVRFTAPADDEDTDDGEELAETSDVWAVRVDESGVSLILDPDNIDLPQLAGLTYA